MTSKDIDILKSSSRHNVYSSLILLNPLKLNLLSIRLYIFPMVVIVLYSQEMRLRIRLQLPISEIKLAEEFECISSETQITGNYGPGMRTVNNKIQLDRKL